MDNNRRMVRLPPDSGSRLTAAVLGAHPLLQLLNNPVMAVRLHLAIHNKVLLLHILVLRWVTQAQAVRRRAIQALPWVEANRTTTPTRSRG